MTWKWRYFAGAAVLASYFLFRSGAPVLPVLAGLGGAALFMRRVSRAH